MKKILRIVETVFNGNRSWRVYAEFAGDACWAGADDKTRRREMKTFIRSV